MKAELKLPTQKQAPSDGRMRLWLSMQRRALAVSTLRSSLGIHVHMFNTRTVQVCPLFDWVAEDPGSFKRRASTWEARGEPYYALIGL